ncbi:MAG TPA: histidine phosphatase family protein [Trebonia sp.]|nr:histidine phosphatase family protein [Trebonia sp.]
MPPLFLIRHGESSWNTLGLAQGHNDQAQLTHRGRWQAAEAAERFRGQPVGALYSSDLRRALQTAAAVSDVLGLPVLADARLRERGLGVLEGTPSAAISPAVLGLGDGTVADPDARPAGGESVRDLYRRAAAFCNDLDGEIADGVVVVAHGGTLRVLHAYLTGVPVEDMSWEPLENARILRVSDFATR